MSTDFSPAFILGVPRSGTTLLRVLLDSHPMIAGAPETSWITGGYTDYSIRQLVESLDENKLGASKNLTGVDSSVLLESARQFLRTLLRAYLEERHKEYLVLKTPDDIRYLDFLLQLFPSSRYIHIHRDGRDVACSTYAKKGTFFGEKMLAEYGDFTLLNALKRWHDWERKIQASLEGVNSISVSYEKLVYDPAGTLQQITGFLGVPFEEGMLDYAAQNHEYPEWEAGSHDVRHKMEIDKGNIQRWVKEIPYADWEYIDSQYGSLLHQLGYETCEQFKKGKAEYVFAELSVLQDKVEDKDRMIQELQTENEQLRKQVQEKSLEIEELKREDPLRATLKDNIISWLRTENARLEDQLTVVSREKNVLERSRSFKLGRSILSPVKKIAGRLGGGGKKVPSIK